MKKIEITVADDAAGTIVALVAEHALELHVTSVEVPADVVKPKEKRKSPRNRAVKVGGKTIVQHILEWMQAHGQAVTREEINTYVMGLGYGPGSGASSMASLVDKNLVARVGNKSYKSVVYAVDDPS